VYDDTRKVMSRSSLGSKIDSYVREFTVQHVGQEQKAEVFYRLCGPQFMAQHHPSVPPNPTVLGPPYLSLEEVSALVSELRSGLFAHVARRVQEERLPSSAEWRDAERQAAVVAGAIYRDEVAQHGSSQKGGRGGASGGAEWHEQRRAAVRLELEGLTAGLDAVLSALPEETADVLEILKGRRLTPRMRAMAWRRRLVTPAHVAAVGRTMERTRADPAGGAPLPSLLGQMVQNSLATTLKLYAKNATREQRLVEAFGSLYLLRETFVASGLATCLVVVMGLAAETSASQAAIADAVLSAQASVRFDGVQDRVLDRIRNVEPMLASRLQEAAWRVLIDQFILRWCTDFLVGVLQPEPLLFLWDQCVLLQDWKAPVEACCVAILLCVRDDLLTTRAATEAKDLLQFAPTDLSLHQLRNELFDEAHMPRGQTWPATFQAKG
jgi:hypothetical protein